MTEGENIGAAGERLSRRLRPVFWTAVVAAIPLLAYIFVTQLFDARTGGPIGGRDYSNRLGIEKPRKPLEAPEFTLEDVSGKRRSLKSFRGKLVFLNFWATWCVPCRQEMPLMEKLYREFKEQGLEIVAVNFREDKKEVRKFFDELGLSFTSLLDPDGNVSQEYGAWSLPLTYVINRKGEFIGKAVGDRKWDSQDTKAWFRELLEEESRAARSSSRVDLKSGDR